MIIGNQEAKQRLKTYLDQSTLALNKDYSSFFLLYGSENIGKSGIALELAQEYLGVYIQGGLLHIKDFSDILGKKHSIKIEENTTTEEYKTLFTQHQYKDMGIREINSWLQQSSFGGSKILIIENIERMTREATNAFLKACEEPLSKRIIIATTSNKSKVLDTILSRAIAIPCFPLSNEEINQYMLQKNMSILSEEVKQLLIMMAMGKPGTLENFYQNLHKDNELEQDIQTLINLLPKLGNLHQKYKIFEKFKEQGILEQFLDGWIAYCVEYQRDHAPKWLKVKKLLQANIAKENVVLYGLLESF